MGSYCVADMSPFFRLENEKLWKHRTQGSHVIRRSCEMINMEENERKMTHFWKDSFPQIIKSYTKIPTGMSFKAIESRNYICHDTPNN